MGLTPVRWYVNDLSLQGQFPTAAAFVDELGNLGRLRQRVPELEEQLYCSRAFGERPATTELSCRVAVMSAASRDAKAAILGWISKRGPFLDDDRQPEENDYFEFEGHDVTDQGLGEAARRIRVGDLAGVFSFLSDALNFERDPLAVQHGLREEPLGHIDVANAWEVDDLEARVLARPTDPSNWADLIDTCRQLDRLTIPDAVLARLARETFYPVVANRTLKLLSLLQEIMEGRAEDGSLNNTALLLWQTHSRGDKALFSDESDINKERFRQAMTFRDPDDTESTLFCHWHGKINTPPFRIHFQWPVPVGEPRLKVVYIGPKITKN